MSEYAEHLREIASPYDIGERVKRAIEKASRRTGLSYVRAWGIWYGKARCVTSAERQLISTALQRKREADARRELQQHREFFTDQRGLLDAADADMDCADVVGDVPDIRSLVAALGVSGGAVD
jgi:hypothetical protein